MSMKICARDAGMSWISSAIENANLFMSGMVRVLMVTLVGARSASPGSRRASSAAKAEPRSSLMIAITGAADMPMPSSEPVNWRQISLGSAACAVKKQLE